MYNTNNVGTAEDCQVIFCFLVLSHVLDHKEMAILSTNKEGCLKTRSKLVFLGCPVVGNHGTTCNTENVSELA